MSLGSEYKAEQDISEMVYRDEIQNRIKKKKWGKHLIKDMSSGHIRNCIKWIKENDTCDMFIGYIPLFEEELKRRIKQWKNLQNQT